MAGVARVYRLGPARRVVNTVIRFLLRTGTGPKATYLMTTTGRRSGEPRTTPVTLVENNTSRWLVAPYGPVAWVHNVRANPTVELRRGRRRQLLRAREVPAMVAGRCCVDTYRMSRSLGPTSTSGPPILKPRSSAKLPSTRYSS